jgi:hypothetical protein
MEPVLNDFIATDFRGKAFESREAKEKLLQWQVNDDIVIAWKNRN